jgi:hypothetical protein
MSWPLAIASLGGMMFGRDSGGAHIMPNGLTSDQWWQENVARNSMKWRVEGAKEAGIHPLAMLGSSPIQAQGSMIGGDSAGSWKQDMGQDLARAVSAIMDKDQKKIQKLNLENAQIDTEMKRLELASKKARLNQGGQTGVGISGLTTTNPHESTSHAQGHPDKDAGTITSNSYTRLSDGSLQPIPSKDNKEAMEDMLPLEAKWSADNFISPLWSDKNKPPKQFLPKGAVDWEWSIMTGSYHPVNRKGKTPWRKFKDKTNFVGKRKHKKKLSNYEIKSLTRQQKRYSK